MVNQLDLYADCALTSCVHDSPPGVALHPAPHRWADLNSKRKYWGCPYSLSVYKVSFDSL
jgi:hypothetical protein